MTTTPETGVRATREFIIVGRDEGTGYTLWDVAPAPVDPVRRAAVLEEIGVDMMDVFGDVNTEHGATGREAVDAFLAAMRERSGLDDYGLTAKSYTERIDECDAVRAHAMSRRGAMNVTAAVAPGPDSFTVEGAHQGVRARILRSLTGSVFGFPAGEVTVRIDDDRGLSHSLDAAATCAVLAAAGRIDRWVLDRTVCLGYFEHGLLHPDLGPLGVEEAARAAYELGYRTVLVSAARAADVRALGLDLAVVSAGHLAEAVNGLNRLAQG